MISDKQAARMLKEIDEEGEGLTDWEIDFVSGLIDGGVTQFTRYQRDKIEEIHEERCGL